MTFLMPIIDEESAELDKLGVWSLNVDCILLGILVLDKKPIERTLPGLILLRLSRARFHYNKTST